MIGINSKLYENITIVMQVIMISLGCFIIAIPVLTIPIAVIIYCLCIGNIVSDRKLFHICPISKRKIISLLLFMAIGICSLYNCLLLARMQDYFISRLIISLLISVNVAAGILVLENENSFFYNFRWAFFYCAACFHKTVLPIFLYIQIMGKLNGLLSGYAVTIVSLISAYFIFKWNYKSLVNLK